MRISLRRSIITNKERLKSLLLVVLLVSSMLQVWVLWGDVSHGFPLPFVLGATIGQEVRINQSRSDSDVAGAASLIFNPYRITICDGGQQTHKTQRAHYPVSRKSELFATINTRSRAFFEDVMVVAPEPEVPIEKWGELVSERSVLIEFRAAISQEIIKWLFDRSNTTPGAPSEIKKLLIVPEENASKQSVCLYVLTNERIVRVFSPSANYFDMQKLINDGISMLSAAATVTAEEPGYEPDFIDYPYDGSFDDEFDDSFWADFDEELDGWFEDGFGSESEGGFETEGGYESDMVGGAGDGTVGGLGSEMDGGLGSESEGRFGDGIVNGLGNELTDDPSGYRDYSDAPTYTGGSADERGFSDAGENGEASASVDTGENGDANAGVDADESDGADASDDADERIDVGTYSSADGYSGASGSANIGANGSATSDANAGLNSSANGSANGSASSGDDSGNGAYMRTGADTGTTYNVDIGAAESSGMGDGDNEGGGLGNYDGESESERQSVGVGDGDGDGESTTGAATGAAAGAESDGERAVGAAPVAESESENATGAEGEGEAVGESEGEGEGENVQDAIPTEPQQGDDLTDTDRAQAGGADAGTIRYMTISDVGGGRFPGFSPDVFCIVEGPKTSDFRRIRYTAPTEVRDKTELENIILTNDIYSYNRSIDYNDTLVFKNITSIYRLYKDGFMEYNYIPQTQPGEKGALAAALDKSISFILNIEKPLLGSADLILSGIYESESEPTYEFTFDYIIDDYPVYFHYEQMQGDKVTEYKNAITIRANANRVVSCRWMLVDLFFATDTKKMQLYFDRIEVGQSLTRMAVTDIAMAYNIDMAASRDAGPGPGYYEWPVWAITSPDGYVQSVNMSEG